MLRKNPHAKPKKPGKIGMTSVEAGALLVTKGQSKDPEVAEQYDEAHELEIDGLMRAKLRESMGFDFEIKVRPNKIHIFSLGRPRVTSSAKIKPGEVDVYGNIINENVVGRLVEACLVLKQRHDAKVAK